MAQDVLSRQVTDMYGVCGSTNPKEKKLHQGQEEGAPNQETVEIP